MKSRSPSKSNFSRNSKPSSRTSDRSSSRSSSPRNSSYSSPARQQDSRSGYTRDDSRGDYKSNSRYTSRTQSSGYSKDSSVARPSSDRYSKSSYNSNSCEGENRKSYSRNDLERNSSNYKTRDSAPRRNYSSDKNSFAKGHQQESFDNKKTGQGDRLQKALAGLGMGSRREIEEWIRNQNILINGQVARLGDLVQAGDKIEFRQDYSGIKSGRRSRGDRQSNKWIIYRPKHNLPKILLYHKPEGQIVSRIDPQGRPTVFEKLPRIKDGKWINIGRLDFLTSGLLLFTDNGELANKLMHPSSNLEREYAVRVAGILGEKQISQLVKGVELDDGIAKCEEVKAMSAKDEGRNRWYKMIITEGRNREIRKMVEAMDLQVSRLMRTRYGPVLLPRSLRRGHYLELTINETEKLLRALSSND